MNQRIKDVFVAISNHKVIYMETNISSFYNGLKAIHPTIKTKKTIKKDLDKSGMCLHVDEFGSLIEIYRYKNPDYVRLKKQ